MKLSLVQVDGALAALFAASRAWLIVISLQAADDARIRYGHNVDSGAITFIIAVVYLVPVALAFMLATVAGALRWKAHLALHWIAVAGAALPFVLGAGLMLVR